MKSTRKTPAVTTAFASALTGCALALSAGAAQAEGEINLLTWEGYADESFVAPFTEATGCTVSAKYIGSGDEIITALLAGRGDDYDLVSPSSDIVDRLIDAGKVEPVGTSRVPNAADFFGAFQKPEYLVRGDDVYGVPYTYGIIRIIVDGDKIPDGADSLSVLWSEDLRNQIAIWDDIEAVYMAGRYLGVDDPYDMSAEELEKAREALIAMKPNVRKYWFSAGELDTLYAQNEIVASNAWESNIIKLAGQGRNIIDITPEEGRGGWTDSWLVVDGAGSNDCVYEWLNYTASAEAQAKGHLVTGFGYSNVNIADHLNDDQRAMLSTLRMDDPEALSDVDWWRPVEDRGAYLEIWNQVKATAN